MNDTSSDTTFQIRAFLARTRPLSGCSYGSDAAFWNGRGLIEELALSTETGATPQWSLEQCADVVRFVHSIEPTKGNCFCNDASEISATCGLHAVLEFVEKQLRSTSEKVSDIKSAAPVADESGNAPITIINDRLDQARGVIDLVWAATTYVKNVDDLSLKSLASAMYSVTEWIEEAQEAAEEWNNEDRPSENRVARSNSITKTG